MSLLSMLWALFLLQTSGMRFPKLRDSTAFGGSLLKGNPRGRRPMIPKVPLHLVFRSKLARGTRSLLAPQRARRIEDLVFRLGRSLDVRVLSYANAGNHLHLLVQPKTRDALHAFTRAFSGIVARLTLGAERGAGKKVRLWDARPWTRIVFRVRDCQVVARYIERNVLEAIGELAEVGDILERCRLRSASS